MCVQNIVEHKVLVKHSRTKSRVQCVVETSPNKMSSAMCRRNKRTKSRVQCVVET